MKLESRQCEWTWYYPAKWKLNLTSRNYCCPPDAQIDFGGKALLFEHNGKMTNITISGSHCGNLTVEFDLVAETLKQV